MPPRRFETKTQWVYSQLRRLIADGQFHPGEPLRLQALAEEFSTSEMPVREALRMLQRDGLVEMHNHRGAIVAGVEASQVHEGVAVRMHLEVLAVEVATPHHTPRSLQRVESLLGRMQEALEAGDGNRYSALNRQFHTALYAPGPIRLLTTTIEDLWDRLWQTRSRALFKLLPAHMEVAQAEHRELLAVVAAGDAEGAAACMRVHRATTLDAWARTAKDGEPPADTVSAS